MSRPRISVAIQHHPRRAELVRRLVPQLAPLEVEIVADPAPDGQPSAWRTYREALLTTPAWATHRLILQDDVEVCQDFGPAVQAAVEARPDRIILFHVLGHPVPHAQAIRDACWRDQSWVELNPSPWLCAIATLWPVRHCWPLVEWVRQQGWPESFNADDEIIGRYVREGAVDTVLATVPSLVQHPDVEPSITSARTAGGMNPDRVAACYIGDCHPSNIDWAVGPT